MENPLYDEELLRTMIELKKKDPDAFMNLVLSSLKKYPELAVEDTHPAENKLNALQSMMVHFEQAESYEDCAFLLEIKKQIEYEADKIRSNKQ